MTVGTYFLRPSNCLAGLDWSRVSLGTSWFFQSWDWWTFLGYLGIVGGLHSSVGSDNLFFFLFVFSCCQRIACFHHSLFFHISHRCKDRCPNFWPQNKYSPCEAVFAFWGVFAALPGRSHLCGQACVLGNTSSCTTQKHVNLFKVCALSSKCWQKCLQYSVVCI